MGDYREFRCESLDVVRLFTEKGHGDELGEHAVLMTRLLEAMVEVLHDVLPNGPPVRLDDHGTANGAVVRQIGHLERTDRS